MSKPLSVTWIERLKDVAADLGEVDGRCIRAAIARLDYLERKVQAAEQLRDTDAARGAAMLWTAYDEVQP